MPHIKKPKLFLGPFFVAVDGHGGRLLRIIISSLTIESLCERKVKASKEAQDGRKGTLITIPATLAAKAEKNDERKVRYLESPKKR